MIEATGENLWYKKKKKKFKLKRIFLIFLTFSILFLLVFHYRKNVCVQINNICSDYAYSFCTDAVNKAVLSSLNDTVKYDNLISIEKNSSGEIVFMGCDAVKVNSLSKNIASISQELLSKRIKNGVPIPILAFTGLDFLSGYGKEINLKTISVSSITSDFESKFYSVGINQTLHSIYVLVKAEIFLDMPLSREKRTFETSVLVAENVLVGKVPEIYLGGKLFT